MGANQVTNSAAAVALTLATEVPVVTVTPQPPGNQLNAGTTTEVQATIVVTGAASATTCTLKVRRGAGITGADITPTDVVLSVDAAATDRSAVVTVIETAANFNAVNGVYTLTATAAGAAQTARIATIELNPLTSGV